jgi:hypothetical protein
LQPGNSQLNGGRALSFGLDAAIEPCYPYLHLESIVSRRQPAFPSCSQSTPGVLLCDLFFFFLQAIFPSMLQLGIILSYPELSKEMFEYCLLAGNHSYIFFFWTSWLLSLWSLRLLDLIFLFAYSNFIPLLTMAHCRSYW